VLGEAGDLGGVGVGPGCEDELVVGEALAIVEADQPGIGVDLGDAAALELDVAAPQRLVGSTYSDSGSAPKGT